MKRALVTVTFWLQEHTEGARDASAAGDEAAVGSGHVPPALITMGWGHLALSHSSSCTCFEYTPERAGNKSPAIANAAAGYRGS